MPFFFNCSIYSQLLEQGLTCSQSFEVCVGMALLLVSQRNSIMGEKRGAQEPVSAHGAHTPSKAASELFPTCVGNHWSPNTWLRGHTCPGHGRWGRKQHVQSNGPNTTPSRCPRCPRKRQPGTMGYLPLQIWRLFPSLCCPPTYLLTGSRPTLSNMVTTSHLFGY